MANNLPDTQHLKIESMLRGITMLLPSEGYDGWEVVESLKRQSSTKIVRMKKSGRPSLAFERQGRSIFVWCCEDAYNHAQLGLAAPAVKVNQKRPHGLKDTNGSHSNIWSFFGQPSRLWRQELANADKVLELLKSL